MENVIIEWKKLIPFSKIETSEDDLLDEERGFYAIITGRVVDGHIENEKLHYIGLAYKQILRDRILQGDTHPAYRKINEFIENHLGYKVFVCLGKIISKIQENDSQKLYKDVESCLIYDNQPVANTQNKDSYNGREIRVENRGIHVTIKNISDSSEFETDSNKSYFSY